MLKGMKAVSIRPFVFLFIVFLLIAGIASGVSTNILAVSNPGTSYLTDTSFDSIVMPLILSVLKNTALFCVCVLCAIWLPGIAFHISVTFLKGFLIGFLITAFLRSAHWTGLIYSFISVIIPECAAIYGFILLSLHSFREWQTRFKCYFTEKSVRGVSNEYWENMRPCIFAFMLSIFMEGVLSPLILGLI